MSSPARPDSSSTSRKRSHSRVGCRSAARTRLPTATSRRGSALRRARRRSVAPLPPRVAGPAGARPGPLGRGGRVGHARPARARHLDDAPDARPRRPRAGAGTPRRSGGLGAARRGARAGGAHRRAPRIAPVAAARAEAAWLEGEREAVQGDGGALDLAVRRRASWVVGELACWRRRAGIEEEIPRWLPSRTRSSCPAIGRGPRSVGTSSAARTRRRWRWPTRTTTSPAPRARRAPAPGRAAGGGDRRPPPARARRARAAARATASDAGEPGAADAARARGAPLVAKGSATRRSPSGCSSRRRRSTTTSRRSCASSACSTRGQAGAEAARLGLAGQDR